MSHENEVHQMAVADLAQKCAQETDLYFNHQDYDSTYCFELFRRAIRNNDERALEVVIVQYQPLVARWVDKWMDKHPDFPSFNEEPQDFIAQAFERFWISFTPAKFDKSQSLAAVLRYLQMCTNGAIMDAWRKSRRLQIEQEPRDEEQGFSEPDPDPTPEELLQKDEFWQLIKKKTKDPKEYIVVYASFHLALSPREILIEYPNEFRDIKEIYQYKANMLERLERDEDVKEFVRRR
jgi:DNA-directed RNA polymerase specialized sigma24 family protein